MYFCIFFIWDKLGTRNSVPLNKQNYIAPKRNEHIKLGAMPYFRTWNFPLRYTSATNPLDILREASTYYRGMRPSNAIQFK